MPEGMKNHDEKSHLQHLCQLVAARQMATVADLAKDGQNICRSCGRIAVKPDNLCDPVKL
jgi:hypothetical protein